MSTGQNLGGRLPLPKPDTLEPAQRALYDTFMETWVPYARSIGVHATTDDGRLIGPFNTFLLHPEISAKLSDLQATEAANSTLPKRVREIAVLVTGAVWGASYELYAQGPVAQALGLSGEDVQAIVTGGTPAGLNPDEQLALQLSRQLASEHHVGDETYQAGLSAFGAKGLYDLVVVMGVYHTVCSALALFEVPAPPDTRSTHPEAAEREAGLPYGSASGIKKRERASS